MQNIYGQGFHMVIKVLACEVEELKTDKTVFKYYMIMRTAGTY